MSAFNDFCIVCDKLCSSNSTAYCSNECKQKDEASHYNFKNVPQLISPVLKPRNASTTTIDSTLDSLENNNNNDNHRNTNPNDINSNAYLIKSPLLLSTNVKDNIIGLNLNDSIPRHISHPVENENDFIAASSINYKKWLNVTH